LSRHRILAAFLLIGLTFSHSAQAQDDQKGNLSLNAIFGGGLPYSIDGGGYVVGRLISPEKDGTGIDLSRQSPFGPSAKNVFDTRPQLGFGGRYELGEITQRARLALRAVVSAALERPAEKERPLMGLASLSILF
jgi:hypothetical protein